MKNTRIKNERIKNIVLFSQLKEILSSFKKAGFDMILLKGAALAETVYPDIGMRAMNDIDVLVKEDQLPKIRNHLTSLGFEPALKGFFDISPYAYVRKDKFPVFVDLHIKIKYMEYNSIEDIWKNALPVTISGNNTLILSPEDNIIHLISHLLLLHGHIQEKWLMDIDLVTRHYRDRIDWEYISSHLKNNSIEIPGFYILEKTKANYQSFIPDNLFQELSEHRFQKNIYSVILDRKVPISFITYVLPIHVKPGIKKKIMFILCRIFPSKEYMSKRYSKFDPKFYLLFYVVRTACLIFKGMAGLTGLTVNLLIGKVVLKTSI